MKHKLAALALVVIGACLSLAAQAPTNVLNPASDLAGKTLVTAEGNRTISGIFSWSVPVRLAPGSSALPGLASTSDQTTGVQFGNGTLGISLSGTQRALFDSNGLTIYANNIIHATGKIPALTSQYFESLDGSALTNVSGSGSGVPTGAIVYFNAACPTGYTEFTDARGRYIVGLVSGGTLDTGVGTALTNQENRAVGQHNHTVSITDPGHTHNVGYGDGTGENNGAFGTLHGTQNAILASSNQATVSSTTGITATTANSGSASGTNAPYIQLRACQKT